MQAGRMWETIYLFPKTITRDDYGAAVESYTTPSIVTRGEVRYVGGNKTAYNEERFYYKTVEVTIRYRPNITETMRVQIGTNPTVYEITYIEQLGRREGLRLTLERINT